MSETKGKSWDDYWRDAQKEKGIYSVIAHFYRKFIISFAVKRFFHKYFEDAHGKKYLHAGCGSAESDVRIGFKNASFVLLDLSDEALVLAEKKSGFKNVLFVKGDVFKLPFESNSFDGIWNLGVMEHFTEDEIVRILKEFNRVLKPNGTCLLFWPPVFGLSVFVLGFVHFVANRILRMNISLHADEVSKFVSRKWADELLEKANLKILNSYFGIKDAFTYVVLVCQKKKND